MLRDEHCGEIQSYIGELEKKERARATIEKYAREIEHLQLFLAGREPKKELLLEYRQMLSDGRQRPQTVNGKLSAINGYLKAIGHGECCLQLLRVQRSAFVDEERELSQGEYERILVAAQDRKRLRLRLVIETICATGIRVSELRCITVEAVRTGRAQIRLKGKIRVILLPKQLRKKLGQYIREKGIREGAVFCTRSGRPLDRSNIWRDMKKLAKQARVAESKVFPHNLRHLFARIYFALEKNLAHLADILGHSSIETTRIYVSISEREHERTLARMKLVI